jgi:23S rRNA A1618 N6-methylase RlmF
VITYGGEEQFVGDIVTESVTLGTQVLWYTSMLGRKTSLDNILGKLAECGVKRVAITEFKQGKRGFSCCILKNVENFCRLRFDHRPLRLHSSDMFLMIQIVCRNITEA